MAGSISYGVVNGNSYQPDPCCGRIIKDGKQFFKTYISTADEEHLKVFKFEKNREEKIAVGRMLCW